MKERFADFVPGYALVKFEKGRKDSTHITSSSSSPNSSSLERSSKASFSCYCMKEVDPLRLHTTQKPGAHLQFSKFFVQVPYAGVQLGEGVYPLLVIYEKRKDRKRRLSRRC